MAKLTTPQGILLPHIFYARQINARQRKLGYLQNTMMLPNWTLPCWPSYTPVDDHRAKISWRQKSVKN